MIPRPFDLVINPETAFQIAELVREFDASDMQPTSADADAPPASMDDMSLIEAGTQASADPIESGLTATINDLSIDAQRDLLALLWVGRGDYPAADWSQARRQARHTRHLHVAQYLEQTPLASDYLVQALNELGYDQEDYEND
ncbi:MAG: DUF3775 domain-containing protein [Henriciella sp.]|nr:DUF3775 domain-containing protein [Henriciella sp.]